MNPRLAWGVAIACALAVAVACAVWIHTNPLPSYYDEALYAIYAIIDVWATRTYGLLGAAYAMLSVDPVVLPTTWLTTNSPAGIATSNQQGGSPFTATYANFSVTRTY